MNIHEKVKNYGKMMKTFSDAFTCSYTIWVIQFGKSFCTAGEGVVRPTMNTKDTFVRMPNCSIGPPNCKKYFPKNKFDVKTHGFHANQSFKSNSKEWGTSSKILIAHQ